MASTTKLTKPTKDGAFLVIFVAFVVPK